jgi:hypothetical protein
MQPIALKMFGFGERVLQTYGNRPICLDFFKGSEAQVLK